MDSLGLAKARATEAPALSSLPARGERRNTLATGERPWGCRTVLEEGDGYESEHWVVVAGTAQGRVGDREVHLVRRRPTGRGGGQGPPPGGRGGGGGGSFDLL